MNELKYKRDLEEIIYSNGWLMKILRTVQQCNIPNWFVVAGVVRSIIWDSLHGYTNSTPIKDVDVIFYDPEDLSFEREKRVENDLYKYMPDVKWDVKNQASVHLWFKDVFGYDVLPLKSSEDGIRTWNSTSIGIRLQLDGNIDVAAPYGLTDLFEMKYRRNINHISIDYFMKRVKERGIKEKWPMVQIFED